MAQTQNADEVARAQPWLDWRAPPTPAAEMKTISSDPADPVPSMSTGALLSDLSGWLQAIKAKYDPQNRFGCSFNIR